jgi:uncharacterized membrane protein
VVTLNVRAGKWLAIGLTASLAINLFLAGVYASHWYMHSRGRPVERPAMSDNNRGIPPFLDRMAEALPSGDRAKFTDTVSKHQPEISRIGASVREARRQARAAMMAENFDRAAAEKAFGELRDRNVRFQQSLHETLMDAAATLPAPARRQMIEAGRRSGTNRE